MTIARDQPGALNGGTSAVTSSVVTWAASPAAGAKVLVGFAVGSGSNVVSSVADNGTSQSTFTADASYVDATSGYCIYIYRADGISLPASGSYTVTITLSTASYVTAAGYSYLGVKSGGPTATSDGAATGTSVSTGTVTPADAGALFFAAMCDGSGLNPETITLTGSGFTSQAAETNGSASVIYALADKIDSSGPAATACTWTLGDSVAWDALIAVYDAASSGVTSTGSASLAAMKATGTGSETITCSGSAPMAAMEATGTGSTSSFVTASGSASMAAMPASGTGQVPVIAAGSAPLASMAASGSGNGGTVPAFPAIPLDLRCELNLAGTWTDVSSLVYQRGGSSAPVKITRGRPDESSQANPATCTWEWNNRDGRFSPRNPLSPYYGQLGRNTPVRWSVPAQTSYLRLENNAQDRAYVNDDTATGLTGSIEMRIALRLSDWQGGILACKWDGGGCWYWQLNASGTLTFAWFDSSAVFHTVTSTVPLPYSSGDTALRATMDATTGTVTFYTAATIDGTYTQLGTAASGTSGAATSILVQSGSALAVGYSFDLTPAQVLGRVYEYRLYNGVGGTVAADGTFTAQAAGATSWTDSAGNTWQLAGGAEISNRNYRGHFEMSAQPPKWDVTGTDQSVMAAAGGPLRRLSQGTANAMSAMKRAILAQSGALAPVAYWPMEDAAGASVFGAALGPLAMTFDASPAPTLATSSSFVASAPLPTFGGSRFYGKVAPYASGGAIVARFLCKLGTITLLPGLTYAPLLRLTTSGTVRALYVVAYAGGGLGMIGYDSAGATIVNTGVIGFAASGQPLWYSCEIQLVSGNVQCSLLTLAPGASAAVAETVTLSGGTVGNCSVMTLNPNALFTDTAVGHATLQSAWSTLFALSQPLNAWQGETAGTRYARLAGENGYQCRITGSPGQSAAMGPQGAATLYALLRECEVADLGQQYEPRQQLGIGYRTLASMLNQGAAVTLDYGQSQPGGAGGSGSGLDPTYDDLLLANDWTLTRGAASGSQGATWQAQLNDGSAMSVSDPPAGIGDYAKTQTVNAAADSQLPGIAGWMVHTGTVDEARWPQVPVNLARPEITGNSLYYPVLDADVGDYLKLTSLPDVVLYDPVKQLLFGTKESLGGFRHTVEWAAVPEVPYEVIVLDDAVHGTADTDGSSLSATAAYPQASLSVAVAAGEPLWTTAAADFPFDIQVSGMRLTVTSITGSSSPQAFTVTPAVNGVEKTLTAGSDVRLWSAPILSLA